MSDTPRFSVTEEPVLYNTFIQETPKISCPIAHFTVTVGNEAKDDTTLLALSCKSCCCYAN